MTSDPQFSASRRAFLKLPSQPKFDPIRPPWTDDASVAAKCTACNACIVACPETILQPDASGKPMVVFDGRECTFCGKCSDACQDAVFDRSRTPPWDLKASLQPGCLQDHGISCQLCRDSCPVSAIRVDLDKRPFGRLKIETAACIGCGACLAVCPQESLAMFTQHPEPEAA
jgi:ferredoxin-type protein NapF